jgi:tetratricopeptide (TPR) repeat protein
VIGAPPERRECLSPRDEGVHLWMSYVGLAKLHLDADAEAVVWLRRCLKANPNYPFAHFELAAALSFLGELDEARTAAKAGLALDPTFTIRRLKGFPITGNAKFRAASRRVIQGMRMAGIPESWRKLGAIGWLLAVFANIPLLITLSKQEHDPVGLVDFLSMLGFGGVGLGAIVGMTIRTRRGR